MSLAVGNEGFGGFSNHYGLVIVLCRFESETMTMVVGGACLDQQELKKGRDNRSR